MAVVELLLPALPAHVRTARLVVVAAARRAGLADELVDEVRLAVGEACARAVGMHARHVPDDRVAVTMTDDVRGLVVAVADRGPAAGPVLDDLAGGMLQRDGAGSGPVTGDPAAAAVDPDVSLGLLAGLVDELDVRSADGGTTVTMTWPLPRRVLGGPGSTAAAAS